MRTKVTKRVVDAAAHGDRDTFIWDTDVKGFGLKVTPAGRKVYVVQTRLNGRLRRYTIGRHGSPWTPDMARNEALRLLADTRQGKDPVEEKRAREADLTVSELCDLYLAEGCEGKKQSTISQNRHANCAHASSGDVEWPDRLLMRRSGMPVDRQACHGGRSKRSNRSWRRVYDAAVISAGI